MQFRRLGKTELQVSVMGLGSGGSSQLGQRYRLPRSEVSCLVRRALDLGINLIDTAPAYRESEAMLGEALIGAPRDSYVLSTKFQPMLAAGDLQRPEALRHSLEQSLRRLRTDHVDVLFLHGVPPASYRQVVERFAEPLAAVRRDGLARHAGISEQYGHDHGHEMARLAIDENLFDVLMVGCNVLSPAAALDLLPLALARDIGVVIMCSVRRVIADPALLRDVIRQWVQEGLLARDAVAEQAPLDWLLGPGVESLPAASYKFVAAQPGVASVLTGAANLNHLEANVRAIVGSPLPADKTRRLLDLFAPVGRNVEPS